MSRTIRRKSAHHERARFVGRLEEVDRWDLERYGVTDPKKCLEKKAARFHGDHYWGGNAPSWFARQLDKKIARANAASVGLANSAAMSATSPSCRRRSIICIASNEWQQWWCVRLYG